VATGSTDHRLISQVDIAPTVLVAAGVTPDPNYPIDGRSLSEPSSRARSLTEYWTSSDDRSVSPTPIWASLRTSQYQYVEYYASDEQTVTFREYYDLANDPWELTNLLHDRDKSDDPGIGALERDLTADRTCSGTGCP